MAFGILAFVLWIVGAACVWQRHPYIGVALFLIGCVIQIAIRWHAMKDRP